MSLSHTSQYAQLTDEHFQLIGKLVVEWSNVQFLLRAILVRLLLSPEFPGRTYTDRLTALRIQEAIDEAVEIHFQRYSCELVPEYTLNEISQLNKRITQVRSSRNKLAHFCWSRSADDEIFGTNFSGGAPRSKKGKRSFVTLHVSELKTLYDESYTIVEKLENILSKLPMMEENGISEKLARPIGSPDSGKAPGPES
ncbi:MAG: hypothetical protein ACYTEL_20005 [Planctomycetota bacterium]|jgi:hypothetical protein